MTSRQLTRALAGASAIAVAALAPAPAAAQQVDRIVAFGDSYADDGNFFQLVGVNPVTTQIYTSGRFSGGTNYIDTLAQILNVPVDNFAIGGALTDNRNTQGPPLGFVTEWNSFLAGGGPAAFPRVSGFSEDDLLAISIGGNDARFYQQTGGTLAGAPAAATASAAFATAGLDALVAAGAPTISFLAGNTASLPEVANNPGAQAIRSAYSTTFNSAMQTTLAGYAANGVIVHYLDGAAVLSNVSANPAAYGITNGLACPAFPNQTCLINASGYLFYGDAVHLTSDGFAIVARYIAAQLTGPLTLGAPSDVGLDTGRQFGRALSGRLDYGAPRDGDAAEGLKLFAVGDAFSRTVDEAHTNREYSLNGAGLTGGIQYGFGNGSVGIAANYTRPEAEFRSDAAGVKGSSLQIGAFAGMAIGPVFAQGYVGFGKDDYDIDRSGVVEDMDAETDGSHSTAGAKAGFLTLVGPVRMGPVVALDYARAEVDGYTEDGDAALTLNVGDIDYDSLRGGIGVEARGDFAPGGLQLRPYAALMLEKELAGGDRDIRFAQTSAPGIVNRFEYDRISRSPYARFNVGASSALVGALSLDAGVSLTFGKDQGNDTSGHVGLSMGF